MEVSITVFTPTYNRANLLPRLYNSLCNQSSKDFEWLIVDDGSTDNTEKVISTWLSNNSFPIRYIKKGNGGKHTAINMGSQLAQGKLFFIADSDDYLPVDSIENVLSIWHTLIKEKCTEDIKQFGGICGLDGYEDGRVVGTPLPHSVMDITYLEHSYVLSLLGDRKEVFCTSVIQEFTFPEIKGENFCPEALIWNRIGSKYKLRYFNKIIYIAEYQESGITAGITRIRMKNPIATMMTYSELFNYNIPIKERIKAAINYWRFAYCSSDRKIKIKSWGNFFAPLGWLLHLNDNRKIRR